MFHLRSDGEEKKRSTANVSRTYIVHISHIPYSITTLQYRFFLLFSNSELLTTPLFRNLRRHSRVTMTILSSIHPIYKNLCENQFLLFRPPIRCVNSRSLNNEKQNALWSISNNGRQCPANRNRFFTVERFHSNDSSLSHCFTSRGKQFKEISSQDEPRVSVGFIEAKIQCFGHRKVCNDF